MEFQRKYELIVWDFDGTLANTLATGLEIYNQLASRHGFRCVEDPNSVRNLGTTTFLKEHGIPWYKVPGLIKEFLAIQKKTIQDVPLFPGIANVLQRFREQDLRLGVLSSNSSENITRCLKGNGALEYFSFIRGYSSLFGKARGLKRLLRKQGLDSARVLYIGDEVRDIEAARKAKIDIAAVTWGFNSPETLIAHKPDYVIHHTDKLMETIIQQAEPS